MAARVSWGVAALAACSSALPVWAQFSIDTVAGGAAPAVPMPATQAVIGPANGCAVDSAGNVYFSSASENAVFKVDKAGRLTRVAGASTSMARSRAAADAPLNSPQGLAFDKAGNLYIAGSGANRVRKLSTDGSISTVAGNGTAGYAGDGGPAVSAQLNHPIGIAVDSAGNVYIADRGNYRIRMVSPGGTITTVAGDGYGPSYWGDGGTATSAQLSYAENVAVDSRGNVYIADRTNNRVRMVNASGVIATGAQLNSPAAVAVDSSGNLFISDYGNNVIRKVTPDRKIATLAGAGATVCPTYATAAAAQLLDPAGLAVDSQGNLYIADSGHGCVLEITPAGMVSTIAGGDAVNSGTDVLDIAVSGQSANATVLYLPQGLAVDSSGDVYIADTGNACVRKVQPSGRIAVVAGNGIFGGAGDGGAATSAQLSAPWSVAVDASGNLYIADTANQRVRRVATDGAISTIAGNGTAGYSGDGCDGTRAQLNTPWSVVAGPNGTIYISDWGNGAIRALGWPAVPGRSPGACGVTQRRPLDEVAAVSDPAPAGFSLALPAGANLDAATDAALVRTGDKLDREQIHGIPPLRPESMPSPAGDSYTPGADPDFSYLSLLQPDLLFVRAIQRHIDYANSLGAMADSVQGQAGSSLLTLRAQVLQYVESNSWSWMMTDPQANIPLTMNYVTALGHAVPFCDTFLPSATENRVTSFSPADLAALKQFLDIMSPELLQYAQFIVNGPIPNMVPGAAAVTNNLGEISINGVRDVYDESLTHEIGVTIFFGGFFGALGQQWGVLWNQSAANPVWDTVSMYSTYPPHPMPAYTPSGDQNEGEDFATVFSNWGGDSGTPRINPSRSSSAMEEAVYRAQQGYPILLEKTLLVAALYTDPSTMQLSLYHYAGYMSPVQQIQETQSVDSLTPILRTFGTVKASPTSLTIGDYTFTVQNGLLTGGTSPASQVTVSGKTVNIPEWDFTFPTPVPIPGYAVTRWGIPQ